MRVHVQCKHVHVGVMYVECVFSEIVFCICFHYFVSMHLLIDQFLS